jgi:hypothetical protein
MKKLLSILPIFVILFFGTYLCAFAGVIKKGDVRQEALDDVKKTVAVFNQIMTQDMKISLPKEVAVYVAADTTTYEQVLIKQFKISRAEAKQWTDNSSGFSTDSGVALNTSRWVMEKTRDRYEATAHELFHQLQYALMENHWNEDPRWMREGTCYFVSNHIVERLGYQNMKSWRRSAINSTLNRSDLASVQEVIGADRSERWLTLSEGKKSPHKMAVLLVLALVDLSKKEPYQSIAEYYTQIGNGKKFNDSFLSAFGIGYDPFIQDFDQWYKDKMAQPAEIEVIADSGAPSAVIAEIKKTFEAGQSFFKEHWGGPLNLSPCILLASDAAGSIDFTQKEFGFAPSDTIKENKENPSSFYLSYDTAIINLYNESIAEESMTFTTASLLARMYGNAISAQPDMEGATWLFYGASDLAAVFISEKTGDKSVKERKEAWLETIRPIAALPRFNELQTPTEYRKAAAKIGRANLSAFIRLAALYLSEKHGLNSLAEWYRRDKELKNPNKAFEKVFGVSQQTFEREFLTYIEQQRKSS